MAPPFVTVTIGQASDTATVRWGVLDVVILWSCPDSGRAASGPVAQLVAHLHGMQGVRGSSPLRSTISTGVRPLA